MEDTDMIEDSLSNWIVNPKLKIECALNQLQNLQSKKW